MVKISSRERILTVAVTMISERGYHETTIGDIEAAAGLTRRAGGFYRHFKSKDDVLVQAIEQTAKQMIAELNLADIVSLKSPRAELLVIARGLIRHAETFRPLRLLIQREGHKLPALRRAARRANAQLAAMDVVPWVENVLQRSKAVKTNARELALIMFGPVVLYLLSNDRADPAFGVKDEKYLEHWADHWSAWLENRGRN